MSNAPKTETDNQEWKTTAVKVLGNLSHDLRSPFTTIQSYINILKMEEYRFEPQGLKELTASLQQTIDKSIKLIDEQVSALKKSLENS